MLTTRYYRLAVVVCALSWLMLGLHLPTLHQMTHHGTGPQWMVLAAILALAMTAVASLWALLGRGAGRGPRDHGSGATPG